MKYNRMKRNGMRVKWNMEYTRYGMWNGMEEIVMEWNEKEWNGMEENGMKWDGRE